MTLTSRRRILGQRTTNVRSGVACICCPIFGYLIDISPTRKLPYLLGLVLLGASMVLLALANSLWMFISARLIQGGATAMVIVAGLSLITDSVAVGNLGQMIGYLGSAVAIGFLLGPFLGGLVYDTAGYHAVFIVAFSIVGVDLVMRFAVIEKKVAQRWTKGLLDGRPSNGEYQTFPSEYHPPETSERGEFVLPLLARQPRILISSWALLVQGIFYGAFDSTIPVFVGSRFNWTAFGAGLTFLPGALSAFFEPYFGYISDTYGNRLISFLGFALLSPTLISLRFVSQNSTDRKILLFTLQGLIGLFMNLCLPALYVETQQVLDEMERARPGIFGRKGAIAQGFSIQTLAQFLGLFFGPVAGGFIEYRFGWNAMVACLGVLAGVTAIPMLLLS
ncbi:Major Facilitator Superfamily, partial [Aspergillus sclerotialis]